MLNYIYVINLQIGADGAMTINIYGKRADFVMVRVNWDEKTIKGCISDTIRRACDE